VQLTCPFLYINFFSYYFGSILYQWIVRIILYKYTYVFLLLCSFRSGYFVSMCSCVYCLYVICTVLIPPGATTTAVNIYDIHNIIWYYIASCHTNGIIDICQRIHQFGRSMPLGSTDRLTQSSTSDIPWSVRQKSFSYPLKRMPGVSHRRCGICGGEKNSFRVMIIGPQLFGCPSRSLVT